MQAVTSSTSSGSTTNQSNSLHGRTPSKNSIELDNFRDPEPVTPRPRTLWRDRTWNRISSRSPRLYSALIWLRGPRPKIDLPNPRPFLDVDVTVKERHIKLPIESKFIQSTRRLTNPWLFAIICAAYIIGLAFFSRAQSFLTPAESFITCTSTYWLAGNGCGLDGSDCGPFNNTTFDFRCPAQCSNVILQNPRTVGDEEIAFVPLIVGGGDDNVTYRGDSFICAAAVQAGVISDRKGGCGTLELIGNYTNFLPKAANGLSSIGFETVFPLAYRFLDDTPLSSCSDNRDGALAFHVLMSCLLMFILRPKPIVTFWCLICIGYWHVTLFSQPRSSPPDLSHAFADFLPALFVAYGFWRLAFRFTLPVFAKVPLEAGVYYLGPFWVGVLFNLTFERIPISRLLASDISKRSGGITALVIVIVVLFVLVLNQVRVIRKTGWLPYYLRWYILGGLVVLVLSQLPGLQLRLHHYIVPMMLIPITAFPIRLSAIYQGVLLGMFLNGIAAYGMDSILQTPDELRQDAVLGSDLPIFLTNSTNYNASIPLTNQTISWDVIPDGWDGFVLLVDDVERYVGPMLNFSLAAFNASLPHFFRLALTSGQDVGDFTKPATLWPNGTWIDPQPGPSY